MGPQLGHHHQEPGALLVASISEAMARPNSGASASTSSWSAAGWPSRPVFCVGPSPALPGCLLQGARRRGGCDTAFLHEASFRVQPRRHQHLSKQVQQFLAYPISSDVHLHLARTLQTHVFSKFAFLAAAQHALAQHFERSSHWRPRNPFRRARHGEERGGTGAASAYGAGRASRQAQRLGELGLVKERELQLEEAAELFARAAALDATSAEWPARASKVWSDMTFWPLDSSRERSMAVNHKAIELGQQAIQIDPNGAGGHVALCVSRGRLALFTKDNRAKVQLARQAQEDVKTALALEPNNDLAHHLLGRWHYEMASLNALVRTLVQVLYGASLMAGSYKEAALCYEAAAALRPDRMIHRVELGRTYLKLGDVKGAIPHFEAAMGMDIEDVNAHIQRMDVEVLLKKLKPGK